ncbi:LOW QUALITY PROTEIN: 60S ribosomal protein L6, partial [Galemys pyrenaicus]
TMDENAEKAPKEKEPGAKTNDTGGKIRKLKAKTPKKGKPHCRQNHVLIRAINGYFWSTMYSRKTIYLAAKSRIEKKKEKVLAIIAKAAGGEKNDSTWEAVLTKCLDTILPKMYLEGWHDRGKRVDFWKQLGNGLLLGAAHLSSIKLPCGTPGICYATSTKTDNSRVKIPRHQEGKIFDKMKEQCKVDQKAVNSPVLPHIKAIPQL